MMTTLLSHPPARIRRTPGMGGHSRPHRGVTDVWLTDPAMLAALGEFDLDPCAAPEPRPWPTAHRHISLPDDGMAAPWSGRAWVNPPYGPDTGEWLERLADHGDGVALVFARTETAMFRDQVWKRAGGILFLFGRLYFYKPDGKRGEHNGGAPSVLVAYGANNAACLRSCALSGQYVPLRDTEECGQPP